MDISGHEGEIPIPLTSTYVTRAPPSPPPLHPHLHKTEDQSPTTILAPNNKKLVEVGHGHPKIVKYKECLKNHAAAMGGNATDGCGEFMPSGEEGTLEAFKCSACNCHRNFHRKAVQGEIAYSFGYIHRPHPPPALIMPLGAMYTTTTTTTSESEEMEDAGYGGGVSGGNTTTPLMVKKRRFRTKFTQEQKEKMLDFADKFGWKLPRQEEGLVQSFCQEIGVKRRVLKVWMHNNKHSLGKIKAITPES